MEQTMGTAVCLICFEITEKHAFVPFDKPAIIFNCCNKYLHSDLTTETLKTDIQLSHDNQLPLCKSCFDSAWELTQLSEQLSTIQKNISDLTVAFSMAVFHRRSQVYTRNQMQNGSQSYSNSSKIEFNEACLPLNLFSTKTGNPNTQQNNTNNDIIITCFDTQTDIVNVKLEDNYIPFDNLSGNSQIPIANDDAGLQNNKQNLNEQCKQPTIEEHRNHAPVSEIRFVHLADGNHSKNGTDPKKWIQMKQSDLLKSVSMPETKLNEINLESREVVTQKFLKEPVFVDDEFSAPCHTYNGSGGGKLPNNKTSYCTQKTASRSKQNIGRIIHIGKTLSHKCSYCTKGFSNRINLQIHERIHTGEKPFECSFCKKGFSNRPNLKIHERIHTGEKPFECSFCKKGFSNRPNLKIHERIHTGEKPFECSFCKKKFVQSAARTRHEKTHTRKKPCECPICEKKFTQMSALKYHNRIHTGENPFECSFCEQSFKSKSILQGHEMRHTGENPYNCLYCEKTFRQSSTRNTHLKTHRQKLIPTNQSTLQSKEQFFRPFKT